MTINEPTEPTNGDRSIGWFRAIRSPEALELIRANPNAFILAYVIAHRARFHDSFNEHSLALGECFLGDYRSYGLTEQKYRTAKEQLEKWHFATFRPTNKGTVAKLCDTRLFAIFRLQDNEPANVQVTGSQRTANVQVTTNKDLKIERSVEQKILYIKESELDKPEEKLPEIPPMSRKDFDAFASLRCIPKDCADYFWTKYDSTGWLDKNRLPIRKVDGLLVSFAARWRARSHEAALAASAGQSALPKKSLRDMTEAEVLWAAL